MEEGVTVTGTVKNDETDRMEGDELEYIFPGHIIL